MKAGHLAVQKGGEMVVLKADLKVALMVTSSVAWSDDSTAA